MAGGIEQKSRSGPEERMTERPEGHSLICGLELLRLMRRASSTSTFQQKILCRARAVLQNHIVEFARVQKVCTESERETEMAMEV